MKMKWFSNAFHPCSPANYLKRQRTTALKQVDGGRPGIIGRMWNLSYES